MEFERIVVFLQFAKKRKSFDFVSSFLFFLQTKIFNLIFHCCGRILISLLYTNRLSRTQNIYLMSVNDVPFKNQFPFSFLYQFECWCIDWSHCWREHTHTNKWIMTFSISIEIFSNELNVLNITIDIDAKMIGQTLLFSLNFMWNTRIAIASTGTMQNGRENEWLLKCL